MMFSDSRPGEVEICQCVLALLALRHGEGHHVADLSGGTALALCAMVEAYGSDLPRYLRGLADRIESDPFTARPNRSKARD